VHSLTAIYAEANREVVSPEEAGKTFIQLHSVRLYAILETLTAPSLTCHNLLKEKQVPQQRLSAMPDAHDIVLGKEFNSLKQFLNVIKRQVP
jgi:hypothetical protein